MKKITLAAFLILSLLSLGVTADYFSDAEALKSKGTSTNKYGSATAQIVCGDKLCTEVEPTSSLNQPQAEFDAVIQPQPELFASIDQTKIDLPGFKMNLAISKVAVDIPLVKGYENGKEIFLVTFDSSDEKIALMLEENIGFPVHFTKSLQKTPQGVYNELYIFQNGITGKGHLDFQPSIFSAKPGDANYSPLYKVNFVKWRDSEISYEIKSVKDLMQTLKDNKIEITKTDAIINSPAVKWDGGSLTIRDSKIVNQNTPFAGGQVTEIDTKDMIVTFVAYRGWGPDGKTLYWLVTDATPYTDDIEIGGITHVPVLDKLAVTSVAVDFYQFVNGITGPGPQGFQLPLSPVNLDDPNYSPIWRIYMVAWKDPTQAKILETMIDLKFMQQQDLIQVFPVFEGRHIVNCPFFDQETIIEHLSPEFVK